MKKSLKLLTLLLPALFISGCVRISSSEESSPESSTSLSSDSSIDKPFENIYYDETRFVPGSKVVSTTKLTTYDGPSLMDSSTNVSIKVENHELFVYDVRVNHRREFTYDYSKSTNPVAIFDFEGTVNVSITVPSVQNITSVLVRPLVYGIIPTLNANTINFTLSYSDNYVIEYNNNSDNAIHLFANPIEEDPITPDKALLDPKITYIGPGIYSSGAIPLVSNGTIYLAGGAYVYGKIRTEGLENVTIRGRGILAGEIYDRKVEAQFTLPIEIKTTTNVTIEGITILDPAGWAITLYKSSNININNVKIITSRANGDGISVQSCSDVLVTKGFVRTWDDSLVVKNSDRGSTQNVVFDQVSIWTDLAQSLEVGFETNGPTMNNVTFKNITIFHNFHKASMSIHNSDDALISNVRYENITIEDGANLGDNQNDGENDFIIDLTVAFSIDWSKAPARGNISGVTFEDINVYQLNDVLGPDEYHERVNDNAFTNYLAKFTVELALKYLKQIPNTLSYEKDVYEDFINNLYLPQPNEYGVIEQFSGYFNLEDVTIDILKTRLKHPNEYWGGTKGVASSTKIIKQADVVTLLVLFPDLFPKNIQKANFDYYFFKTEHGSSLSSSMYGLLALYLNNVDYGYQMFLKSSQADLDPSQKLWAGKIYIGGTHPASAGGTYQCIVFGFLGLKIIDDKLLFFPKTSNYFQSIELKYYYLGKHYQVIYNNGVIKNIEIGEKDD